MRTNYVKRFHRNGQFYEISSYHLREEIHILKRVIIIVVVIVIVLVVVIILVVVIVICGLHREPVLPAKSGWKQVSQYNIDQEYLWQPPGSQRSPDRPINIAIFTITYTPYQKIFHNFCIIVTKLIGTRFTINVETTESPHQRANGAKFSIG